MDQPTPDAFLQRMVEDHARPVAQAMFSFYFEKFQAGETGEIPEEEIAPPRLEQLLRYEQLPAAGTDLRGRVAMIKLNGGLGTSMGLTRAKSLLEVKPDVTFLDVIARQTLLAGVPLVLMNSYSTDEDTMDALRERHPALLERGLLRTFVQNRFPRIETTRDGVRPLSLPDADENWNPPGHGDLYPCILVSGVLDELLGRGIEVAFVSNSDNLGAVMDPRIAGHMLAQGEGLPFLMEVRERGEMDRKGGHLALRAADGQLILREKAQCPEAQMEAFKDIRRYGYFNTNNLWINLRVLKRALAEADLGFLPLPMIRNGKDVQGHSVVQLESAMGAAVEMFPGAAAMVVPPSRHVPVKTTNQLLVVRSDAYELDPESSQLLLTGGRTEPPTVTLNQDFYKTVPQLERAFPEGIPSLRECAKLKINAERVFPAGTRFVGDVTIG